MNAPPGKQNHMPNTTITNGNPLAKFLPPLAAPPMVGEITLPTPPTDAQIHLWWDRYEVAPHIRAHSAMVAKVAHHLALRAADRGLNVNPDRVLAGGLLHDIAKTYSVTYGGNHSQTGAAWALELTGDLVIAQCVYHHVYWPFSLDIRRYFAPLAVLYADKRVTHTTVVPLTIRYEDLIERYGCTDKACDRIRETERQALEIESLLSDITGENVNESTFDRGRLVE